MEDNDGKLVVNDHLPDPDQPSEPFADEREATRVLSALADEALAEEPEPKPKRTILVAKVVEGVQQGYHEVEVEEDE